MGETTVVTLAPRILAVPSHAASSLERLFLSGRINSRGTLDLTQFFEPFADLLTPTLLKAPALFAIGAVQSRVL